MGTFVMDAWNFLSADNFAAPRCAYHVLSGLLAATGSA